MKEVVEGNNLIGKHAGSPVFEQQLMAQPADQQLIIMLLKLLEVEGWYVRPEIITNKHHYEVLRNGGAPLAWFRGVRSVVSVDHTVPQLHVPPWSQQP